jgi:glycosyltransferase involved in cell wall biosynthesis
MGASCAIICSVEGEAASLVVRAGAGLCIQPENSDQLVDAIRRLRNSPEVVARFGVNGRRFVTTHYLRSTLAERYLDALSKVVGGPHLAEHTVPLITDH